MSKPIIKEITKIQAEAHCYGEGVQTRAHFEDDVIVIDLIAVPVSLRRQGIATQILDEYIAVADGWGVKLMLEASTDFSTPRLALHNLYSQAGFTLSGQKDYIYYPAN